MAEQMERSSWIRRMFEIGIQLKQERGPENVFDYSIGNPEVEPPDAVIAALRQVVAENRKGSHGYMPNAGYPRCASGSRDCSRRAPASLSAWTTS